MRRLATLGALAVLAFFGALSPLPAYADIQQSTSDKLSTDYPQQPTFGFGALEYLGTNIQGALSQASFRVQYVQPAFSTPGFFFQIIECTDPTYTSCNSVAAFGNQTLTPDSPPQSGVPTTATVSFDMVANNATYVFDPSKYYKISISASPTTGAEFKVFGSASDTYIQGYTDQWTVSDLTFALIGPNYIGSNITPVTRPTPPTVHTDIIEQQADASLAGVPDPSNPTEIQYAFHATNSGALDTLSLVVANTASTEQRLTVSLACYDNFTIFSTISCKAQGASAMNYLIIVPANTPKTRVTLNLLNPQRQMPAGWSATKLHDLGQPDLTEMVAGEFYVLTISLTSDVTVYGSQNVHSAPEYTPDYPGWEVSGITAPYYSLEGINPSATPPPTGVSNVLFLPGILTSRLYMKPASGPDVLLWEPLSDALIPSLVMVNGQSKNTIYVGDIIDSMYGGLVPIYAPFINFMNGLTTSSPGNPAVLKAWKAYPYDWRYDVVDIVNNGTLKQDGSRDYVDQDLIQLASSSPTGKVTIVAHSNGGLLAKALMLKLQQEGKGNLVDKIIFVGAPQLGTPKTIGQMLHGDELTQLGGILMYSDTVRQVASTMPGMYGLLPSPAYFTHVSTPLATFKSTATVDPYSTQFGTDGINSYQEMVNFLTDSSNTHVNLPTNNPRTPLKLSQGLLDKEKSTHALLDAWNPTGSTTVTTIAGWGQPTPSQYLYTTFDNQFVCTSGGLLGFTCGFTIGYQHIASTTEDGDDTIVSPSAAGDSSPVLYFNAKDYLRDRLGNVVHKSLLSANPIEAEMQNIFAGNTTQISYITSTKPSASVNPLSVVSAHSPINLLATDASGNQTGLAPVLGTQGIYLTKQDIPGSFVEVYDDEKYLYIPRGTPYNVQMTAYASGTTTLELGEVNNDGSISTTQRFGAIPTATTTTATFTVSSSNISTNPQVDFDGNGTIDFIASSTATSTPPVSQLLILLRQKINALNISPLLKALLLAALQEIENRKASIKVAHPFILALEKLVWSQTDAKIMQQRQSLLEFLYGLEK